MFEYVDNEDYMVRYRVFDREYRSFAASFIAFVTKFIDSGYLLDVGCGPGYVVEAANRVGFRAEGIEINQASVLECKRRGIVVHSEPLAEANIDEHSVDVIVMSHVLEHITDLPAFFADVRRVLRPDGWLIVAQPLHVGFMRWLLHHHWYGWCLQQHIWHFDTPSLTYIMQQEGFERQGVDYNPMYYAWLPRAARKQLHLAPLYIGSAILARLAGLAGRGDQVYFAARRQPGTADSIAMT